MGQGRKGIQRLPDAEEHSTLGSKASDGSGRAEPSNSNPTVAFPSIHVSTHPGSDDLHEGGISLEALGHAFAKAMQIDGQPLSDRPKNPVPSDPLDAFSADDVVPVSPRSILEAILFVGTRSGLPFSAKALSEILRGFSAEEIQPLADELNRSYRESGRPLEIIASIDGYAMQLASRFDSVNDAFVSVAKEVRLSQNALDCISLIAYQPGITKESLELQWGQSAGSVLSYLIRKGLVRTDLVGDAQDDAEADRDGADCDGADRDGATRDGATNVVANGKRYFTTERFLEILGLESLEDLPRGDEL
jgi:segregation and condensation protein B